MRLNELGDVAGVFSCSVPTARSQRAIAARLCLGSLLLVLVGGCAPSTGLTIHNGLTETIEVTGLPGGAAVIAPGQLHREGRVTEALTLVAKSTTGSDVWRGNPELPPPGGEALWAPGGAICLIQGDFSQYYELDALMPAQVRVEDLIVKGTENWVSRGLIAAGPGERLPKESRGTAVRALVRVPCAATASKEVARGWLEMTLAEIQP